MSDDKESGVFLSPTRGLVEYDSTSDTFSDVIRDDGRISDADIFPETEVRMVFGDAYLLLKFSEKSGLISVLRAVFSKDEDYERILIHMIHGITKDSFRITCDSYFIKSFASYVFPDIPEDTLKCDTRFFTMLGQDHTKLSFFRPFVSMMKERDKDWGLVKDGYFVLISNIDTTPEELLSEYFGRTAIESVVKTNKEYLDLLPLSKWTDVIVRGKILHDIRSYC